MKSSNIISGTDGTKQLISFNKTQQKTVRQVVRPEDEYLSHIGTIIQRDFFPDLAQMKGEAPATAPNEEFDSPPKLPRHNPLRDPTAVGLDKYLANNTTEDNASFIEIVEDAEKKRETKLAKFFASRSPTGLGSVDPYPTLAIEGADSGLKGQSEIAAKQGLRTGAITMPVAPPTIDSITSHNSVHFIPDGAALTAKEMTEHFNRDRIISAANSRFKRPVAPVFDRRKLFSMGGALKAGRFGIDGREVANLSESPTATPRAGGYKFMDASPSTSLSFIDGGCTPLMTWGEVDSTPYRLDEASGKTPLVSSGTPLAAFRIPSPSKRETIAHELADRAGRQRAKHRADAVKLAKSGFVSPHASKVALSPAARRLLSSSSGKAAFGSRSNSVFASPASSGGITPRRLPTNLGVVHRPTSTTSSKPPSTPPRLGDGQSGPPQPPEAVTNNLLNLIATRNSISSAPSRQP